jgi:thiol-disulfide isomerase/thioredoxin
MKKYIVYIVLFASLSGTLNAQGFRIAVRTPDLPIDSLFIRAYSHSKKQFHSVYGIKYEQQAVFADKKFLPPGLYLINADTNILIEFLISDNNQQQFLIDIQYDTVFYQGSDENTANLQYQGKMREYEQILMRLGEKFYQVQQSDKSLVNKQVEEDFIIQQSEFTSRQKMEYQAQVAEENKGKLLASIILSVMETPSPPEEYYNDKTLYYKYLAEHCFDKYDFSDSRLLATPLANNKFQTFSQIILELEAEEAIVYVLDALRKSQVSPQQHSDLFDYLEHDFGDIKSPVRKEPLYIAMLNYIVSSNYTDTYRKERYLYELGIIDKNHAGDRLPNFNFVTDKGDTTNLYAVEAERLLLFLQNPNCPACKKFREAVKEMQAVLSNKKITVLTIYFEEDKNLWQSYLQTANPNWKHGWNYDLSIDGKNLIDIRSIPTLYLLDANKTVLKKDITIEELEEFLLKP